MKRLLHFLTFLTFVTIPLHSLEVTTSLIPRHILFGNAERGNAEISPDGNLLAYLAPNQDNIMNVWVKDLKQSTPDQLITSDTQRPIKIFFWQYDNEHILYFQDQYGDENWHLYQTSLKTLETRDLTPYKDCQVSLVKYIPTYPDEILVTINLNNKSLFDVYRINLKTGKTDLDTKNPSQSIHFVADQQLNVRACQSFTKEGATLISVRDERNSPWRPLLTIDPEELGGSIIDFSDNDESLYLISSLGGSTERLLRVEIKDGSYEVIAEDPSYDLKKVIIHPISHRLEAVAIERDRLNWVVLDPLLKHDYKHLEALDPNGIFSIFSRSLDDQKWIIVSESDQRSTQFYLYDRQKDQFKLLFSSKPLLDTYQLCSMQPISFQSRDGLTIHGYLTLPNGKEPKNLPTVLFVHGGPWTRDSWRLNPNVQWLANRGYAVLQVNYRGSSGYGKEFLNAGNKEWGGRMHNDLLDAKYWLIQNGYTDPNKIAIYGGSYGGYATLVALTFTPDEFSCGIDIVGPSSLITLLDSFPPYWAPLKAQMNNRIGNIDTENDFLRSRSPLFKADNIKKPLLIGHGANDPRVKQAESDQIVQVMRQKGLPVEYLLFNDEGHGFAKPINRLKFFAAAEVFLAKHLEGECQPPTPEENWESIKR